MSAIQGVSLASPLVTLDKAVRPEREVFVVLPAYNERPNLKRLIESIDDALREERFRYRVVAIDDGSPDGSWDLLQSLAGSYPLVTGRHTVNQGLGRTIRDGLVLATQMASERDVVVTMDADGSHLPGLIPRMVQMIGEGHDAVIASRYQPGARVVGVPGFRRLMSTGASWIFRLLLPTPGVRDLTSGFRAYRASLLKRAFDRYGTDFVESEGFQCMVEILIKLRRLNPIFGEVPMILRYDQKQGPSKMRVARTVAATLRLLAGNCLSAAERDSLSV
jgi:dolichol-phosphate mannosyltransferase